MDEQIDLSDLVEEAPSASDAEQRMVALLVELQAAQQDEVDRLEEQLKAAKTALAKTAEQDLPEALMAVGYTAPSKLVIAGHPVEFSERYRCGQLSSAGKTPNHDGLRWLIASDHGDLIKNEIVINLNREHNDVAREILDYLRTHRAANAMRVVAQQSVHAQTLAAFCKERVSAGEDVPLDTLKVQRVKQVKVG